MGGCVALRCVWRREIGGGVKTEKGEGGVRKSLAREATLVGKRGWAATKLIISAANNALAQLPLPCRFREKTAGVGVVWVWCGAVCLRHAAPFSDLTAHTPPPSRTPCS
jgi:hypothetical protein